QAGLVAAAGMFTIMMLLLVAALNSPFADGPGRISPRLITEAASTMRASPNATTIGRCPELGS
ncbi:MAG TPA: hypothetical protein PKA87_15710, partial [Microthrixaceae bacterium]|nr:hypothetical protein [Microthrixaceae bacterium]